MPEKTTPQVPGNGTLILEFHYYIQTGELPPPVEINGIKYSIGQHPVYSNFERTNLIGNLTYQNTYTIINKEFEFFSNGNLLVGNEDFITFVANDSSSIYEKYNDDRFYVYRIVGGKGIYTYTNGYVVINILKTGERICYVYATN